MGFASRQHAVCHEKFIRHTRPPGQPCWCLLRHVRDVPARLGCVAARPDRPRPSRLRDQTHRFRICRGCLGDNHIRRGRPLGAAVAKGAVVKQGTAAGNPIGTVKSEAIAGATSLKVSVSGTTCVQGGAVTQVTTGCFVTGGTAITVGVTGTETSIGSATAAVYTYRNMQGFSTAAKSKMIGQVYYQAYRAYWGVDDYANQFVLAALGGVDVTLTTMSTLKLAGKSNAYRNEVAKKGSVYWNVWMYVVREMEDAINDCSQGCTILGCNDDPVHAWDEAVAFYTGSLETKLLYTLADKRCKNFGTCTNDQDNDK